MVDKRGRTLIIIVSVLAIILIVSIITFSITGDVENDKSKSRIRLLIKNFFNKVASFPTTPAEKSKEIEAIPKTNKYCVMNGRTCMDIHGNKAPYCDSQGRVVNYHCADGECQSQNPISCTSVWELGTELPLHCLMISYRESGSFSKSAVAYINAHGKEYAGDLTNWDWTKIRTAIKYPYCVPDCATSAYSPSFCVDYYNSEAKTSQGLYRSCGKSQADHSLIYNYHCSNEGQLRGDCYLNKEDIAFDCSKFPIPYQACGTFPKWLPPPNPRIRYEYAECRK